MLRRVAVPFAVVALAPFLLGAAAPAGSTPSPSVVGSPAPVDPEIELPTVRPSDVVAADSATAQMLAGSLGEPVEDLSARSADVSEFATGTGQIKVEQFFGDQFVEVSSAQGETHWEVLDTDLEINDEGTVSPAVYPRLLTLAPDDSAGPLLLSAELGERGTVLELYWNGSIPEVEISGPRATYPNIAPGIDYVVDVLPSGFEQYFVVDSRQSLEDHGELALTVAIDDGSLHGAGSSLEVRDVAGEPVGEIPAAMAWDAGEDAKRLSPVLQEWRDAGTFDVDPEHGNSVAREVPVDIELSGSGPYEITLVPDASWLSDATTEYPVVIDPIVATVGGSTPTAMPVNDLDPSYDTLAVSAYPNNNYSSLDELRIGTWDGGSSRNQSYLNFAVSKFKDKDIVAAQLNMYMYHSWSCSQTEWQIRGAEKATSSTNWKNLPTVEGPSVSTKVTKGYSSSCNDGWAYVDVTPIAQYYANEAGSSTVRSLRLKAADATNNYQWKRFYSSNYSVSNAHPSLTYVYNQRPNTPGRPYLGGKTGKPSDPVMAISSGTTRPTAKATVVDPDGGSLWSMFGIEYQTCSMDSSARLKTVQGSTVSSGSSSSWKFDFDMRRDRFYSIVARADDGRMTSAANIQGAWVVRKNSYPATPSSLKVDGRGGSGTVNIDDGRPTFSATVTDPDGTDELRAYFKVYDDDGYVQASGWGSWASSGGKSSWTVPSSSALKLGKTYYVRAKTRDDVNSAYDCNHANYRDSAYTGVPSWRFELANEAPNTPTNADISGRLSTVGGTTFINPRPQFSAKVSDPDGSSARLMVRVTKDGEPLDNEGQIYGTSVANGQVSRVTLPYAMEPGARYTFELFSWDGYKSSVSGATFDETFMVPDSVPREIPTTCDDRAGTPTGSETCGGA